MHRERIMRRLIESERGTTLIMVGLSAFVLMGLSAFVLDFGVMWLARRQAQACRRGDQPFQDAIGCKISGIQLDFLREDGLAAAHRWGKGLSFGRRLGAGEGSASRCKHGQNGEKNKGTAE